MQKSLIRIGGRRQKGAIEGKSPPHFPSPPLTQFHRREQQTPIQCSQIFIALFTKTPFNFSPKTTSSPPPSVSTRNEQDRCPSLSRRERNIFPKFLHIYFVPSRVTKEPFFTPFWKKFLHLSPTFRPNFERYVPGIDVNVVPRPWNCSFFRTISTKKKKVKNRKSSIPLSIDERISRVRLPPIQCETPFEPKGVDFSLFLYNNNNRLEKLQERRGNESTEGSKND